MASALSQETQIGNPDAAQDLYGLGVRVGFYLQVLAMIFYSFGEPAKYGRGLKLSSGSITLSILVSWYNYAANGQFSAAEAVIVLLLLMDLSFPAKSTLLNPHTIAGEIVGLVIILSLELLTCAALLWTFATLVDTLPTLATKHIVWFFTEISSRGAFRYVALAYCILDAITSLFFASNVVRLIVISWHCYRANRTESEPAELTKIEGIIAWWSSTKEIKRLRSLIWMPILRLVYKVSSLPIQESRS